MAMRRDTETTGRVYIAPVSFGLGDLVVSLPAIQALVDRGRGDGDEVWLVTRSDAQRGLAERIKGLIGSVTEEAFDRAGAVDRFVDLRDHPLQRDHWWGSPEFEAEFGPLSINDILARICADLAIDADFTRPAPLVTCARPDLGATVLFVADSDGPSKSWRPDRWRDLAFGVQQLGLDARIVGRHSPPSGLDDVGIPTVLAPTPGEAVDVLSAARAVVGIDTGLTHIAVQQQTATVTICRDSAVYFRAWPHTRVVKGAPCDATCTVLEREYAYNDRVDLRGFAWQPRVCPVGARCLEAVQPRDVLDALEQVL
jgi:hypothetical protein